jgi:hypothetical protein
MRLITAILCFAIGISAQAEIIVYKSQNGKYYAVGDTSEGPKLLGVRIIDLSSNVPRDEPNVPDTPDDRFGLRKVARDALSSVDSYSSKKEDTIKLSAFLEGLANAVQSGTITRDKLELAFQETLKMATLINRPKWDTWYNTVKTKYFTSPINSQEDAVQALRDISLGLKSESVTLDGTITPENVDWQNFLKIFMEYILPIIIKLLGK